MKWPFFMCKHLFFDRGFVKEQWEARQLSKLHQIRNPGSEMVSLYSTNFVIKIIEEIYYDYECESFVWFFAFFWRFIGWHHSRWASTFLMFKFLLFFFFFHCRTDSRSRCLQSVLGCRRSSGFPTMWAFVRLQHMCNCC